MSNYTPECWKVIEFSTPAGERIRKVFGGWRGGFADGDRWKLNSGITETIETVDYYDFIGYSGSSYRCYKTCEGLSGHYLNGVFDSLVKQLENYKVEIIDYETKTTE